MTERSRIRCTLPYSISSISCIGKASHMSAGVPCASSHTALFRRRRSEYTVLYRTVQGHLATWLERSSDSQQGGSVGRPTSSANFAAPSNVASWPMTAPVPAQDHADTAFRLPALAFLPRSASVFCGRSPGANCSSAKTCKPWVPGNTAGASRSMPAYASKQTIAGGWSLCCGTAPGRPSRWNDYGKSLTGTGSMRASGRAWGEHPPDAHAARSLGGPDSATTPASAAQRRDTGTPCTAARGGHGAGEPMGRNAGSADPGLGARRTANRPDGGIHRGHSSRARQGTLAPSSRCDSGKVFPLRRRAFPESRRLSGPVRAWNTCGSGVGSPIRYPSPRGSGSTRIGYEVGHGWWSPA